MKYTAFILLLLIGLVGIVGIVDAAWGSGAMINLTTTVTTDKYPMYINLTRSVGVSNTTMIFTNGTTETAWSDIEFTDSACNVIPHWLETKAASGNVTRVWFAPSAISSSGTTVYMNFDDSAVSDTSDGYNTFFPHLFDDFAGASVNATLWTGTATSVSGGVVLVSASNGIRSLDKYGTEHEYVTLTRLNGMTGGKWGAVGFGDPFDASHAIHFNYGTTAQTYIQTTTGGATTNSLTSTADSAYHIFTGKRNGGTSFITSSNFTTYTLTTNIPTAVQNISLDSRNADGGEVYTDWILVRPYQTPEPSVSSIVVGSACVAPEPTPTPTGGFTGRTYTNSAMPLVFGIAGVFGVVAIGMVVLIGSGRR
jgi:hypothetical protein